jgi:hypothetical protein
MFVFRVKNENIDHLPFTCPLARYMWNVVRFALGVSCQFNGVDDCFLVWFNQFTRNKKKNHHGGCVYSSVEYLKSQEHGMLLAN